MDGEHAELAADPRVGVGHHGGTALVAGGDETGAMAGQGVGEVEVAAADHAEDGLYPGVAREGGADPVRDGSRCHRSHDEGEDAGRGPGAADDGQRGGDDDRARGRELVEVAQLGEAVLARAEDRLVAGEGRGEAERLAGVGADGFHAEAEEPGLGQVGGGGRGDARGVRATLVGVGERGRVVAAR